MLLLCCCFCVVVAVVAVAVVVVVVLLLTISRAGLQNRDRSCFVIVGSRYQEKGVSKFKVALDEGIAKTLVEGSSRFCIFATNTKG